MIPAMVQPSGFPQGVPSTVVIQRREWTDVPMDGGARITFRILDRRILEVETHGHRAASSQPDYARIRDAIVDEMFPDGAPYVEFHDISDMDGLPSNELRATYSAYHFSRTYGGCRACLIFGGNILLRSVFQIGIALQGGALHYPMRVVANRKAAFELADTLLPGQKLAATDFVYDPSWTVAEEDGSGRIVVGVGRGRILHLRYEGNLRTPDIAERMVKRSEGFFRDKVLMGPVYYAILDFRDLQSASWTFRWRYSHALRDFQARCGCRMERIAGIGLPTWLRLSLRFSHMIFPANIRGFETEDEAREYIARALGPQGDAQVPPIPQLAALESLATGNPDPIFQTESENTVLQINAQDLDRLVCLLGTLAWDVKITDVHFPKTHPLHTVAEAIRLVKDDYHSVLERHRLAEQDAQAASRTKSAFLATMSHEIRTPMNGVLGMTDLLLDMELSDDQRAIAQTIRSSAHSLLGILNDILDLTKLEAGRMEVEAAPFVPAILVREIANLFSPKAQENRIHLLVHCEPDTEEPCVSDSGRLRQILLNLVGNAVKFTTDGSVRVDLELLGPVESPRLSVRVRDTGPGISEEAKPRIFEVFTQADASTARRFGGTGLGLAICKRLTDLLGGTLEFESQEGVGSTFRVEIPVERHALPVERPAPAVTPPPPQTGRQLRILIAEDNVVNQKVALGIVNRLGHVAKVAWNGAEAADMVAVEDFDIVLMDMQMPEVDGLEGTARIRALPAPRSGIPVIAMTANAMKGDRQACLDAGMDDYLAKPVSRSELASMLDRWGRKPRG